MILLYSGQTTNYNLPQYEPSDKPKYLTDFNTAMQNIDTNMKTIDDKTADGSQALETANQANTTAQSANTKATQAQTSATQANNILATFFEGFTDFEEWTPSE